jgi:NAD-dependent SIR2 family protein deacetylase
MAVNPLIPLAVSLAECKGQYAVFLGSGVSVSAGIPTGGQIFKELQSQLYKQQQLSAEDITYEEWISTGAPSTYSEVFSELTGDNLAARRKLLEPYFLNKQPTEAHRVIAELVKDKMVKVIVTTNFDDLMETALQSIGVPFTVVTDDNDLAHSEPREQVSCRIYKIHGDFRMLNVRNTAEELDELPPGIVEEMEEVFSRYGLIVLGYSGGDLGVMRLMSQTNSVYSRYWISRGPLPENEPLKMMLSRERHHIVESDSADGFLIDLQHRILVFTSTTSGDESPYLLFLLAQSLLESGKTNRVASMLRKHTKQFLQKWPTILTKSTHFVGNMLAKEIVDNLSHVIVLGWAFRDFMVPEREQLLQDTLYDLSRISPIRGNSWNDTDLQLSQIPLQVVMIAWGAVGVFRGDITYTQAVLHALVRDYSVGVTEADKLIPLYKQDFWKHAFNPWSEVTEPSLFNIVFEAELLNRTEFVALCARFDLLKAIKRYGGLSEGDIVPAIFCNSVNYGMLSPLVARIFQSDTWDLLLGISPQAKSTQLVKSIGSILKLRTAMDMLSSGAVPIPPIAAFQEHLKTMEISSPEKGALW